MSRQYRKTIKRKGYFNMKFSKSTVMALAFSAMLTAACTTAPVLTPSDVIPASYGLTNTEIKDEIIAAAVDRDWTVINSNDHEVEIAYSKPGKIDVTSVVEYTANSFEIKLKHSSGPDAYKDGKIHRNYNRWVNNLKNDIDSRLNHRQAVKHAQKKK